MSSNIIYTSIPQLLQSCKSIKDQLDLLDLILVNMLLAINTAASTGQFEEYKLDTGQTQNQVRYRSLSELQLAYKKMLETREMVEAIFNNKRQGRVHRLVDSKNFTGRRYGRF